jgi:hypothetical protein
LRVGTDIRDNLRAAGFIRCGEERWGTGGDPLSLARQLQRGERRRGVLFSDSLDSPPEFEERPHRRRGCKHRESTDAKKG